MVECACGCETLIEPRDKKGRLKGFVHGHISRIRGPLISSNWQRPAKKLCNDCNELLLITAFSMHKYRRKTDGIEYYRPNSRCRPCLASQMKKYKTGLIKGVPFLEHKRQLRLSKQGNIKAFVQDRISGWRKNSPRPSDLTVDYLINLFNQQSGKCYYTGSNMNIGGPLSRDSLSLERLTPLHGYVQGNVVWCSYLLNTMKQNLTEQEFYDKIRQVLQVRCTQL